MNFGPKTIKLKNGRPCTLRSPRPEDGAALLDYLRQTSEETPFLLRYPDEVTLTSEEEERYLADKLDDPRSLSIAAFVDGRLAGNAGIYGISDFVRCRHRAEFGIAIRKDYWGLGVGSALLAELADCAPKMGYEQLELGVVTTNEKGIALYQKMGFVSAGTSPRAFRYRDGSYADEYRMVRYL